VTRLGGRLTALLRAVPAGTLAVGVGLAVLGVASYVHLAVAGHALDDADQSSVSVLWAIVFSIGIGLFMPVEQEVARLVAARSVAGEGVLPVLRTATVLTGAVLAAVLAILAVAAGPIADRLFDGDRGMVLALGGAFTGLAAEHLTRGVLSGVGRFGWYGAQLAVDGGLRIVIAGGLGLAGVQSPVAFAMVLAIAPVAAVVLTMPAVLRGLASGAAVTMATLSAGLGLLVASSLLAQLVANIGVVNVRLFEPADSPVAGALLSALVLARIPLFVFASLQASLLPALVRSVTAGDIDGYRRQLVRALAAVAVLGAAGAVAVVALGPFLVRVLFDVDEGLTRADFAWLGGGTLAYMIATVLGQAVVARGWHAGQAVGWLVGTVVLVAVTLGPGDVRLRVELAFAIGSLAVIPVVVPFAWRRGHSPDPPPTDPLPLAAGRPVD
jgi:O-antigen/teichoic acid export membrane protein